MDDKQEIEEILKEIKSAPETFKLAIQIYEGMTNGKDRAELGKAIREAREALTILDITLEDIQIDLEYEFIRDHGHY
jgi:pilus assembly protein TadC